MGKDLVSYQQKMRAAAREYAATEKIGGSWITLQGGIMHYGDEDLPGNGLVCIVLDAVRENAFYSQRFDPNLVVPPNCYAFGYDDAEMAPDMMPDHEWFEPQAETCHVCPQNRFGSADTGRGKACGNRRRLALMPAGMMVKSGKSWDIEVWDTYEDFAEQDTVLMKLPPTSIKAWSRYVNFIAREFQLPPFGVITHISIEKDPDVVFRVAFDMIEKVPEDLYDLVLKRNEEAEQLLTMPYDPPDPEVMEAPKQRGRQGLKGLRSRRR